MWLQKYKDNRKEVLNVKANGLPNPWIASLVVLLPCVSAVAAYMRVHDVLLGVFLAVGLSAFVVHSNGNRRLDDSLFMLLVWSLSISLIFSSTLSSDYIVGYDINREYLVATQTSLTGFWSTLKFDPFTSLLSVAVLPVVINNVSALSLERIFKFVYPAIFSLVPVILYAITRKILSAGGAFLSAFLFMSYEEFYDGMLGLARQEMAEFLLVLLVLVLLSHGLSSRASGRLLLILLTAGFALSHYSLFFIFVFILTYSCLTSRAFRKTGGLMLLGLISVVGVAWYTFVAGGIAMFELSRSISSISGLLTSGMFNSSSRPGEVLKAIGSAPLSPGPLQQVNRWIQLLVQLSLFLGFVVLAFKKKSAMEKQMFPLMTGGLIVLGGAIVLPGVAATLSLVRFYHIALLFISPFFIYGLERVELALRGIQSSMEIRTHHNLQAGSPKRTLHLATSLLFLYFIFASGLVTAVTAGAPTSYVLDGNRMRMYADPTVSHLYYSDFSVPADVSGAIWLRTYDFGGRSVCADVTGLEHVLTSYGEFRFSAGANGYYPNYLPDVCDFSTSYVYLGQFNNRYGVGVTYNGSFPMYDISPQLSDMNRVYSNGETTVYA